MPPPLPQVESQPEDLIGSADVDGASALLDGHMPGKVPGLSAASENPASNGTENPPPVNQQAEKSEKTETPASNGTENHPLVNQQAEVLETNGSGSHPGPTDEAKTPALNGGAEQPNFPTGTEKPSVIPPIQPGGKKNNKGVPWYDPCPVHCSSASQPPTSCSPPRLFILMPLGITKHPMTLTPLLEISSKPTVKSNQIK